LPELALPRNVIVWTVQSPSFAFSRSRCGVCSPDDDGYRTESQTWRERQTARQNGRNCVSRQHCAYHRPLAVAASSPEPPPPDKIRVWLPLRRLTGFESRMKKFEMRAPKGCATP
jgi:hypothetical protein